MLRRAERTQRPSGLLLISVNAIGTVNTRLGIDVGDEMIAATGRLLKAELASSDTIGLYETNTLAIIVDDCDTVSLRAKAEALMEVVRKANIQTAAGPLAASISVGGVALPEHARTAGEATQNALGALDLAKQKPSGAFVAHDPAMAAKRATMREQAVSSSVISALQDGRMLLVLQPLVESKSRKLAFYEALLRLRRRDGTLIAASDFVEDAEKLGLARRIDRRALELGLKLLVDHPQLRLSINISSLTIGDEDWFQALQAITQGRRDILERLIVEMTETAMIHDFDAAGVFFERLRAIGCKVAIDDFGAGYTSIRHLRSLKVDMLKIDGALVADLPSDPQGRVLVKSVIEMAHALGLETVAEWVSTEEEAAFLEAAGVTYFQGYLFGQPTTPEELKENGLL